MPTRWAVLGPGAISRDFVTGLRSARHGVLHAVGSTSPERAASFAAQHDAGFAGTYAEVLARDDVDAVYVGTVHTTHAAVAIQALEAGKAVLCEKPASPTVDDVDRILAVATRTGRPFLEAFKNRFGPFADALTQLVAGGQLGTPTRVEASAGFTATTFEGRLFDPALAGGAILDMGCYPVSLAVQVAAAAGAPIESPRLTRCTADMHGAVEATATAEFGWGEVTAALSTSIVSTMPRWARVHFTGGEVLLPEAWGSRTQSPTTLVVRHGADETTIEVPAVQPMGAEADAVSLALADGRVEVPEMPWAHTRSVAQALSEWRAAALG